MSSFPFKINAYRHLWLRRFANGQKKERIANVCLIACQDSGYSVLRCSQFFEDSQASTRAIDLGLVSFATPEASSVQINYLIGPKVITPNICCCTHESASISTVLHSYPLVYHPKSHVITAILTGSHSFPSYFRTLSCGKYRKGSPEFLSILCI